MLTHITRIWISYNIGVVIAAIINVVGIQVLVLSGKKKTERTEIFSEQLSEDHV